MHQVDGRGMKDLYVGGGKVMTKGEGVSPERARGLEIQMRKVGNGVIGVVHPQRVNSKQSKPRGRQCTIQGFQNFSNLDTL